MNETSFIASIHAKLPKEVYTWKINARYIAGVADAWYCGSNGGSLWVEYKFLALPSRDTSVIRPPSNDNQEEWLIERQKQGQRTALIIGVDSPKKHAVIFDHDIPAGYSGITKAEFMARAVLRTDIVEYIKRNTLLKEPIT